jgi:hypothetical protein
VPASTQEPIIANVSQETQEVEKNIKVDDTQKENVSEADKADSTKDTAVSTSTHAPGVSDVSQETEEENRKRKQDGHVADYTMAKALFASTQAPQVPGEAKPREGGKGVGEDQAYFINTDDVFASTHAPVNFDMTTPEFSQVHDPAPSESLSTNNDNTEEDKGNNKSMSTHKDDEYQKDKLI